MTKSDEKWLADLNGILADYPGEFREPESISQWSAAPVISRLLGILGAALGGSGVAPEPGSGTSTPDVVLDTRDKGLELKVSAMVREAVKAAFMFAKADVTDARMNVTFTEDDDIDITVYTDLAFGIRVPGAHGPRYFDVTVKEWM